MDPTQWLELFQTLSQTSKIHVPVQELVPDVMRALVSEYYLAGLAPPGRDSRIHICDGGR